MTDLYVGIDPGKTGGVVVLDADGKYVAHTMMPVVGAGTKRSRPSLALLTEWVASVRIDVYAGEPLDMLFAIERVSSAPNDGPVQAFSFGRSLQVCFDLADSFRSPVTEISPKDWQKVWLRGHRRGSRNDIKASAALVAGERFPQLAKPLQRKNRWGLADAALIGATARLIELQPTYLNG